MLNNPSARLSQLSIAPRERRKIARRGRSFGALVRAMLMERRPDHNIFMSKAVKMGVEPRDAQLVWDIYFA